MYLVHESGVPAGNSPTPNESDKKQNRVCFLSPSHTNSLKKKNEERVITYRKSDWLNAEGKHTNPDLRRTASPLPPKPRHFPPSHSLRVLWSSLSLAPFRSLLSCEKSERIFQRAWVATREVSFFPIRNFGRVFGHVMYYLPDFVSAVRILLFCFFVASDFMLCIEDNFIK